MSIGDGLKNVFLAGVGAIATTGEAAKKLVDDLVAKGELTVDQGKVLNEELKHSAKEKINKHVSVNFSKEYENAYQAVDSMSQEDLETLKERIAQAEENLKQPKEDASNEDAHSETQESDT